MKQRYNSIFHGLSTHCKVFTGEQNGDFALECDGVLYASSKDLSSFLSVIKTGKGKALLAYLLIRITTELKASPLDGLQIQKKAG